MISLDVSLSALFSTETTMEGAEIIGRNMWHIGLKMQAHRRRIEREEAEILLQREKSLKKALKIKVPRRNRNKAKRNVTFNTILISLVSEEQS